MDSTDRHIMWRNLIGEGYDTLNSTQKKKVRIQYAANHGMKPGDFQPTEVAKEWVDGLAVSSTRTSNALKISAKHMIIEDFKLDEVPVMHSFVPLNCWEWNMYTQNWAQPIEVQKKEETTMENLIQDTKHHLRSRLDRVDNTKRYALDKAFFLDDETPPKNTEEALDRIAKGMYDVENKDEDLGCDYDNWTDRLHWRNPANKPDRDGRKAAGERLQKTYQRAMDDIQVLTSEEGLKALREFEDTDFSK